MRLTVVICALLIVFSLVLMGGKATGRAPKADEEISIPQMQYEIVTIWNTWYEEQDEWTKEELKENKKNWPKLAKILAETVKRYQYTPVKIYTWKSRTTTLPKGKDTHLMTAIMAIWETKVRNDLEGDLGEIGILQCHPKWCLTRNKELNRLPIAIRKKKAKENPSLNIDAAIKHLTVSYGICNKKVKDLNDWAFPVAHYGAGTLAIEKGRCKDRGFARARVYDMKKYRKKIRQSKQNI